MRGAVPMVIHKPGDDKLPPVPPARKWIVEFLDGSVFEVWAHAKEVKDDVNYFHKITGYRWSDRSYRGPGFEPWVPTPNHIIVAEIPTTAYKMIRQG